ncbi:activating signal cointegrator 1-like isoform X1 [Zingiber officinale]|uniref:Zinc finger C2HC5-type domain-containing protein n=2 Tax=Zingiber officinale TaxID=94328 RepID=A0A8J5L6T8_ZINOF|nr:activating signal cointegrator 1-like isoform X1 [Zingiber officinale]KAG6514980.1 hypothetical protein ZIOFF_025356 [Zingiber officinale]
MAGSGEWLEAALVELSGRMEAGLSLDRDLIHGLVSFCELAPPQDAADYLNNIVGQETGQPIIQEYMKRRGVVDSSAKTSDIKASSFKPYVKPPAEEDKIVAVKKQTRVSRETNASLIQDTINQNENEPRGASKGNSAVSKKKKSGRVITLAEAAKGTVVFQQGKPCSCQARRHKLVSNCLSCGKIVCEQEGEGPCNFCGALVLKEGSTYAGLSDMAVPLSEAEAAAEAYSKRLVEYDRNSAARTKVIDDQSDYYEIEGNSWLSAEEKQLIQKKKKEIEEADEARRGKVVVTFDLLGRKVILNKDEALDSDYGILRPSEERESNRIKPNPTIKLQPVFVETGARRVPAKGKPNIRMRKGLCLEISGRVQHDNNELLQLDTDGVESASVSGAGAGVLAR